MSSTWFLSQTKTGREDYAAANVRRQGHGYYLPVFWNAKAKKRQALFPSYIFIESMNGQWRWIESTYGITRVVAFGGEAYVVPKRMIEALKSMENQNGVIGLPDAKPSRKLQANDRIRLTDGTFKGCEAIVTEYSGERRVCALLNLLGRRVPIEVEEDSVEIAEGKDAN